MLTNEKAVEMILEDGTDLRVRGSEEMNKCADHIVALLMGAGLLYEKRFYPSSVALSVAAMEEIGKTEMASVCSMLDIGRKGARRDPLFDHKTKQVAAAAHTVGMDQRLIDAIGEDAIEKIYAMVHDGSLKSLRENALYWNSANGSLTVPEDVVDRSMARDILLFSIETFEDRLVGLTHHITDISYETDDLFKRIASEC